MIYYVAVVFLLINTSFSAPTENQESLGLTTYDQKQSGKYNIHLNIKDVAIIAVEPDGLAAGFGDNHEDYYDYDISDFTVKPIFGFIGDLPAVNSTPSIFHSEPTESFELSNSTNSTPQTDEPSVVVVISSSTTTEKPLDVPSNNVSANKTQNVVILGDDQPSSTTPITLGSVTILSYNQTAGNDTGIVVTTKTPTDDELPPKLPLEQLANGSRLLPLMETKQNLSESISSYQALVQTEKQHHHPSEIPVHIVMEPIISSSAVRHNTRNKPKPAQRIHYKVKATPAGGIRRITPPRFEGLDNLAAAYGHHLASVQAPNRRNTQLNGNRQRCNGGDQDGKCQTNRSGM